MTVTPDRPSTCPRLGQFFAGCQFEARYDEGAPTVSKDVLDTFSFADDTIAAMEASKPRRYVHDICVRCGEIRGRADAPAEPPK